MTRLVLKELMPANFVPEDRHKIETTGIGTNDTDDLNRFLDEALSRVGRLESILAATGGALHDVNNLLTVLAGNLYLMTEAVRDQPKLLEKSRGTRNTAQRASSLIRELLDSARDPEDQAGIISPAKHVVALEPLLRRGIDKKHRFEIRHSRDPWTVAASASQFESAVMNLVINANEAMSEPGAIEIRVENVELDPERAQGLAIPAGNYVRARVMDNGPGIPARLLARITQPLVTTKPTGQGNGMGLAMVKRFAARSNGTLSITSAEGRGTTMGIWLPRSSESGDATANMTLPLSTLPGGNETVLLVTDDGEVCETVQELLESLGYRVVAARDRGSALTRARKAQKISAVICERSEENRERETRWLNALRRIYPDVRQLALLQLGDDGANVAPDADASLHRPLAVNELADAVRSVIGVLP